MPEETTGFPRKMYNEAQDVIEVECQETMDLALSRGWKRVPPALNTIPKIKARIAELEGELTELKENLTAKIHETEVAMKAEQILDKMKAEEEARVVAAQKLAEEQAEKEEAEAAAKAEADAQAAAEAEVTAKAAEEAKAKEINEAAVAAEAKAPSTPPPPAAKAVEFGEKGKKK